MNSRRLAIIIASIVVSGATLALILRDIPVSELFESLRNADAGYLLLSFLLVVAALVVRGLRWWELLDRRLPPMQAFHMVNVMFLGNQLPLRAGEVARSVLARRAGIPLVTSATSIVLERLIDLLIVVVFIALPVSQLPEAPPEVTTSASVLGVLALVGFFTLLLLAQVPQLAQSLLDRILALIPPLGRLPLKTMLSSALDGLKPLADLQRLAWMGLWTALAWAATFATFYLLHLALGIEVNFALSVPLGISLTALSIALPVSIAALGPFEAAIVFTGQLVGMDPLDAITLGLLLHGVTVASYALWGTIGLMALGASPSVAFGTEAARQQR